MRTKQTSGRLRLSNMLPYILYGSFVLVLALLQMSPRGFPVIMHARPTPLILLTVCIAMLEGPAMGSIMGIASGLLWNLYSPRLFGYYGLMLMLIGVSVGLLVQWLLRANFLSAMFLCCSAVAAYTLLDWLLCYVLFMDEEAVAVLMKVYLPNALYTVLLAPLVYWLILWMARLLRRRKNI